MEAKAHVMMWTLPTLGVGAVVCVLLGISPIRAAPPPKEATFPLKGTVVALHVDETTEYAPITPPDSKGRTHGGEAFVHRKRIYRVETDNEVYELEGGRKTDLAVGDIVEFRVHKNSAEVRLDGLARKFRIISHSSVSK